MRRAAKIPLANRNVHTPNCGSTLWKAWAEAAFRNGGRLGKFASSSPGSNVSRARAVRKRRWRLSMPTNRRCRAWRRRKIAACATSTAPMRRPAAISLGTPPPTCTTRKCGANSWRSGSRPIRRLPKKPWLPPRVPPKLYGPCWMASSRGGYNERRRSFPLETRLAAFSGPLPEETGQAPSLRRKWRLVHPMARPIPIGAHGESSETVELKHTLSAHHAELPPVYSTPDMIRLMETACSHALQPYCDECEITVGISIHVEHRAASGIGMRIHAEAVQETIDGRFYIMRLRAHDDAQESGSGTVERAVVHVPSFDKRMREKARAR